MSAIKILIVEDEPIVAEDIAGRLQKMNYQVVGMVESGEAAIAIAAETQPDLVLMDIVLEGDMDGIEAAQQIREQLQIPVVYLTANADETTLNRAKATMPFGYILKPFKARELQATIEIALSRHQAEVEVSRALDMAQSTQKHGVDDQERRNQFMMMASHELRTPLSIVKFSASMIRERGGTMSDSDRQRHLAYIDGAVQSMNQLIEDVLMLGEVDCCRTEFRPDTLDVVEFCQNLVESLQWSVSEHYTFEIQVEFLTEDTNPIAHLDQKLLWHLLNNLLSNAVKYSPPNSTIELRLLLSPTTIEFRVQDQGIGIPASDQPKLFEPFHRARNVGSVPGTGLGLAIARRSVELHSGHIAVNSEEGKGTTFTVVLPRR